MFRYTFSQENASQIIGLQLFGEK